MCSHLTSRMQRSNQCFCCVSEAAHSEDNLIIHVSCDSLSSTLSWRKPLCSLCTEREGHGGQSHIWLEAVRCLSSFVWTGPLLSRRCCRRYLLERLTNKPSQRNQTRVKARSSDGEALWGILQDHRLWVKPALMLECQD